MRITFQYLSEGPYINTGMFVANSLYDTAQLAGIVGLGCLPPNCSDDKMEIFYNFGKVSVYMYTQAIDG